MAEQLVCSQERVKDLETQIKDLKQLEQENEVLRATIQQLTVQPMPSIYHIELRKMSITQVLDEPYVDFYLDSRGNKTITIVNAEVLPAIRKSPKIQIRLKIASKT